MTAPLIGLAARVAPPSAPAKVADAAAVLPRRLVERVLKQICSIEATAGLWHPVDKSEKDYYAYVKNPNSLSKIDGKWRVNPNP